MDPRDRIVELLEQADDLPEGPAQIAVCEEAVRLADAAQDEPAQFHARKQLTKAAVFGGAPDVAAVSFAWTLAAVDRDPEEFAETELLWQYKWLVENMPHFAHIPRAQIEALFADMLTRYERNGSTLHAVYQIRRDVAVTMGEARLAELMDAKFRNVKKDEWSNCPACVLDATVEYHISRGEDKEALTAAKPALAGKVVCAEVPHRTHAYVLLPFLRTGDAGRAAESHKAGYRLVRSNPKFITHQGLHLAFLALTRNYGQAARLFARHLPDAIVTPSAAWRFDFYAAGRLLADRVLAARVNPDVRLPDAVPAPDGPGRWQSIGDWLDGELSGLVAAFNARNGNDWYTRRLADWRDQGRYVVNRQL